MLNELSYALPAFAAGLLGNIHCLGMCGGLSGALSCSSNSIKSNRSAIYYQVSYNLGRISTYILLGLIAGSIGHLVHWSLGPLGAKGLRIIAGVIIICLGLYFTNLWRGIEVIERVGMRFWQRVSPVMSRLLPVKSWFHAYFLGMIWGLLPCGLVYTNLSWAASSGGALTGMSIMGLFGLGTLPSMLATGIFAQKLTMVLRSNTLQLYSGIVIICLGVWTIAGLYLPHHMMMYGHHHHHHHH